MMNSYKQTFLNQFIAVYRIDDGSRTMPRGNNLL